MGKKIGNKTYQFKRGKRKRFRTRAGRDRVAAVSERLERRGKK